MSVELIISSLSVLFALAAAVFWFKAGTSKVSPSAADALREAHIAQHGRTGYAKWTLFDGSDLEFTLSAQARWNRYGALAAAGAAALQAVGIVVSDLLSST